MPPTSGKSDWMPVLGLSLIVLTTIVSVCSSLAAAQAAPGEDPIIERPRLRVDLTDFRQIGQRNGEADFADFFRTLTVMQLRSLRGLEIVTRGEGATCLGRNPQAAQQSVALPPLYSQIATIVVSATATVEQTRSLLDVEMTRCHADTAVRLLHTSDEIQTQEPLPKLLVLVGAITRTIDGQIPRPTVSIRATAPSVRDTVSADLSINLADQISQRLERQKDLRVSDTALVSDVDYAFTTSARLVTANVVEGRSVLRIRGSSSAVDSVVLRGRASSKDSLAITLADSTLRRFAYWRHLDDVRGSASVGSLTDSALEVRAKRALCLVGEVGCQPNSGAAVLALDSAIVRRPTASRFLLLGRAERLRGNTSKALSAFRKALSAPGREAIEPDVLTSLVSALRDAGDNAGAIAPYRRLVELFPKDSVLARESAINLRLARRSFQSLRAFADVAASFPGWAQPVSDFSEVLRGLDPRQVADSASVIANICVASRILAQSCYGGMRAHAASNVSGANWRARLHAVALTLIQLADSSSLHLAESHAYLALSILGSPTLLYEGPGRVVLRNPPNVSFDSARQALETAGRNAERAGDKSLREWILRLRAQYALMNRDSDQSFALAVQALSLVQSNSAKRIAASAALLSSERGLPDFPRNSKLAAADSLITPILSSADVQIYLAFVQAKHVLGQDTVARDTLTRILRDAPANSNARWALSVVCNEFLKDFPCAYRILREAYVGGRLSSYADTLNAVEAALVVDSVETARRWLAPALPRPAVPCERAVAFIFAYWIAASRQDEAGRRSAEHQWNDATTSAAKSGALGCWIFEGDKAALTAQPRSLSPAATARLLEMMRKVVPDSTAAARTSDSREN